jgi:hypothetical protein
LGKALNTRSLVNPPFGISDRPIKIAGCKLLPIVALVRPIFRSSSDMISPDRWPYFYFLLPILELAMGDRLLPPIVRPNQLLPISLKEWPKELPIVRSIQLIPTSIDRWGLISEVIDRKSQMWRSSGYIRSLFMRCPKTMRT